MKTEQWTQGNNTDRRMSSLRCREVFSENEPGRCCGRCRFGEKLAGEGELLCRRHKIRTGAVCQCGEWERKPQ